MARDFPCTQCGSCCRRAGLVKEWVSAGWADEGGPCKFLTPENLCAIYETRPEVCKADWVFENMPQYSRPSWAIYLKDSAKACNSMMDADGVPSRLRIGVTP
jgi:Fe-S-cluster containining protein